MSGFYKVGGDWKSITSIYAKVLGIWNTVTEGYQKVNGGWVRIYIGGLFATTGVQIGDLIISPESVWNDINDRAKYSLLDTGQTFDELLYPLLFEVYGTNVIPLVVNAEGSPFPYKVVADLQQIIEE